MKISRKNKGLHTLSAIAAIALSLTGAEQVMADAVTDGKILINEVESDDADGGNDWIEIINTGETDVDISGWFVSDDKRLDRLSDGSTYRIPEGTVLKAGEVLVLEDGTDFDFGLGKADEANLYNKDSALIDSFSWSGHASGTYSRIPGGTDFVDQTPTKGSVNVISDIPDISEEGKLVINEINSAPDDWVELMNVGNAEMNLSGFEIRDNSDDHRFKIADGTTLKANELLLVDSHTVGLVYDDQKGAYAEGEFQEAIGIGSGDSIRLYDSEGNLLDSYSWTEHASYNGDQAKASLGRYPDGTGSFIVMPETPGKANNWFVPQVVINEVESNGDETDWVEIKNIGTETVDISGWYILDNDPAGHKADVIPLAEGTELKAGEYFVFDEKTHFDFGLGKEDKATVYNAAGDVVAEFSWSAHANGVYARIPDGTGEFTDAAASTKGTANSASDPGETPDEPEADDNLPIPWPGDNEVVVFDTQPTFLEDSSGLDFFNGQLYAVDNGTGKFWVLDVAEDGTLSFAEGFENGKRVRFQKDADNAKAPGPDAEGITVDGDGMVYLAVERDNDDKKTNYNVILMVDPSEEGPDLVALKEWDLTDSLPAVSANMGIEAVEWVSNEDVAGKLFDKNTNKAFDPADYPKAAASGVFFVALEDNGHAYAYVLNDDGSSVQIADIDSTIGGAMALDFDTYEKVLWIAADNGFGNVAAKVTLTGNEKPDVVKVAPPTGVDVTRNNEGFAIADAAYTINGQRPVYRFTDGLSSESLTIGSLACDYTVKPNEEEPSKEEEESTKEEESPSEEASKEDNSSEEPSSEEPSSEEPSSEEHSSEEISKEESVSSEETTTEKPQTEESVSESSSDTSQDEYAAAETGRDNPTYVWVFLLISGSMAVLYCGRKKMR